MYCFYNCKWRLKPHEPWKYSADVYEGSFSDLVLLMEAQPEEYVLTLHKEIAKEDYDILLDKLDR